MYIKLGGKLLLIALPIIVVIVIAIVFLFTSNKCDDAESAMRVAEYAWDAAYGKEVIDEEKPFNATLRNDGTWFVEGSLPFEFPGGTAMAVVNRKTCEVVDVIHGK